MVAKTIQKKHPHFRGSLKLDAPKGWQRSPETLLSSPAPRSRSWSCHSMLCVSVWLCALAPRSRNDPKCTSHIAFVLNCCEDPTGAARMNFVYHTCTPESPSPQLIRCSSTLTLITHSDCSGRQVAPHHFTPLQSSPLLTSSTPHYSPPHAAHATLLPRTHSPVLFHSAPLHPTHITHPPNRSSAHSSGIHSYIHTYMADINTHSGHTHSRYTPRHTPRHTHTSIHAQTPAEKHRYEDVSTHRCKGLCMCACAYSLAWSLHAWNECDS